MALLIELPPDIEAKYAAEARAKGVPLAQHVAAELIEKAAAADSAPMPARPLHLPTMRGTVIGSLRRRDIYADR